MAYYKDLRHYIQALEKNGKLVRIKREINKDTELQPLVRWQFLGLPEQQRKAFLFENVVDVKGKKYASKVLVAAHGSSTEVYALAMMCTPDLIMKKWEQARLQPIRPQIIAAGPVQEEIHKGDKLLGHGCLDEFPVPLATPGFDNAPYFSAACWVTKDPETGVRNVGTYRAMVKSQSRVGCDSRPEQDMGRQWLKYKEKGITMPAAAVIGAPPNVGLVAVTKFPYGVDEFDIAGGIAGEPVELVKCQTVDLEVPAAAEVVIEGEVPTDCLEREGAFGEYTGYMGFGGPRIFMNITCITHRKRPIWNDYISQFPPSESSTIRALGSDGNYYKFLKYDLSLPNLVDVAFHRESGAWQFLVISLRNATPAEVWKALNGAVALNPRLAKWVIAVDDDIDPRDLHSVIWALCYRVQPAHDIRITPGKTASLDPSGLPPQEIRRTQYLVEPATSSMLIDATRKWDYPPVALPRRKFMERAKELWEELGLPPLSPRVPWYGYSLGNWTVEDEEEAELALKGEHYQTGEKLAQNRIKV